MKKKIFALLTALCMTAAVLPAVFADGEEGDLTIGSTQEQCSCVTLCTEGNINSDCPVCSAEGADLTACKGEPVQPVLYGAPKAGDVTYIDADGQTKTLTENYTTVYTDTTSWNTGWYVVQDTITISNRVTVKDNVHLILADGCNLTVNGGIEVEDPNSLTIYAQSTGSSMGELNATGTNDCAGIGGGWGGSGGTITINGGEISANGSGSAAGIGGGSSGSGGKITINGGVVTANSKSDSAGIGGGIFGSGGEINIEGGVVKATGSDNGAGIGGGTMGDGGTITISGGIVTATGGYNGAGIGGGWSGGGSFSTGIDGNAIIFATGSRAGIDHKGNQGSWQGVIFEGNDGKVYGTNVTPTQDFTIPSDKTLTIEQGKTLTIPAGVTMTNEGTIHNNGTIQNEGAIHNNGTIEGSGTLYNNGTLTGNTPSCKVENPTQPQPTDPTTPETTAPTDTDHTVQTDNSGHASVEDNTALPSFWDLVTERINATPRGGEITINMGARAVPDSVLNALRARKLTATFRYGDTELTLTPDQLPPEGTLTEWTLRELGNYVAETDESIRISVEKSEAENAAAAKTTAPAADTGKPNPATGETTTTAAAMLVAAVALTGLGVTLKKTKR